MSDPSRRLDDVIAAAESIADHLRRGALADGLVYDAVRMRLLEIGEAVKDIPVVAHHLGESGGRHAG